MTDYSHLKALAPSGEEPVPYTLPIEGEPIIWFLPATEANKPFYANSLKLAAQRAARRGRGKTVLTPESVAKARDEDKVSIAEFCARKWTVKDAKGKDVPFSKEECLAFFNALPDFLFDDIRGFVVEPTNFVKLVTDGGEALGEP